jgi:hypothetical protein
METKARSVKSIIRRKELPVIQNSRLPRRQEILKQVSCNFDGYDVDMLLNYLDSELSYKPKLLQL